MIVCAYGYRQINNLQQELLNAKQAAELLPDTSAQTLLRWARAGDIESIRLPPGRRYFERRTIEALLTPTTTTPSEGISVGELVGQQELAFGCGS